MACFSGNHRVSVDTPSLARCADVSSTPARRVGEGPLNTPSLLSCARGRQGVVAADRPHCAPLCRVRAYAGRARGDVAIQGRARAVERPANVGDRVARVAVQRLSQGNLLRCVERLHPRSAATSSTCSRRCQTGLSAFTNQVALKFRERAKDWKTSLPVLVVVSIFSVRLRKPMPRSCRAVMVSIRCLRERPS